MMRDWFLRQEIRQLLANAKASLVRWGRLSRSAADGYVTVDNRGAGPHDARDVRIVQHYGLRSRLRPGGEVFAVAVSGGSANLASFATEQPGSGPQNQEDDDVELYSDHGQRVILNKDKRLQLKAGGTADTVLNDGTQKVAREGDTVRAGFLRAYAQTDMSTPPQTEIKITFQANIVGAIPVTLLHFKAPGVTLFEPVSGNENEVQLDGRITSGRDTVKA